jgi:hypothetical protein
MLPDARLFCQPFGIQAFLELLKLFDFGRVGVGMLVIARGQMAEEPFYGLPAYNVLFENGVGVGRLHTAVPDCFWIDHHVWAVAALVQAAGAVDAHLGTQPGLGDPLFKAFEQTLRVAIEGAVGAIGADEDVFLVVCQVVDSECSWGCRVHRPGCSQ